MKSSKIIAGVLALFFASASFDADARLGAERLILQAKKAIVGLFTPSSVPPQVSANFGPDNALYNGPVNNALRPNGGAAGAFYVPSVVTKSWFVYVEGVVNDDASYSSASANEFALSNCAVTGCSSGNFRYLKIQSPASAVPLSFMLSVKNNSNYFWTGQSVVSAALGGTLTGYTNGIYQWTATGGGCSVAPSGVLTVGTSTSGQISKVYVTNPGQNCTSAPTLTGGTAITSTSVPGIGAASAGTLTLTLGYSTGITVKPAQRFCGVIGQYGSDATSATSGVQFAHFVDGNGTPLTNSPSVATTINNSSAAAGFYYSAAGTLSAQSTLDIFTLIGSSYTTSGAYQQGWGGQLGPVGMIYGEFPNVANVPSTTAIANLCTKSQDIKTWAQGQGFTVHSLYRLNDAGTWADSSGSGYANASVIGAVTAGSPSAGGTALSITDPGPYTIYPVTNYTSGLGNILVNGTYTPSTLGGIPTEIQAQVSATPGGSALSGCTPSCAWQDFAAPVSGTYSGSLSGVPAGGPYYVSVRPKNAPSYVYTGGPVQVGLVVGFIGQSQMNNLFNPSSVGYALSLSGATIHADLAPLDTFAAGIYPYNTLTFGTYAMGHTGLRPLSNATVNASTTNVVGDSITAFINGLTTLTNATYGVPWPIEVINFNRSGMAVDIWANGYVLQGPVTLTGSGPGPYTATLAFLETSLGGGSVPAAVATANTILNGTTKFFVNGVLAAIDAQGVSFGVGTSTICTGQNGFTVSACSINYLTGAASITFASTPAATPTATWTNIVDLAPQAIGASVQATQYDGVDMFGNGQASSGFISAEMARVPAGLNVMLFEQCTANEGEFVSPYATAAASMSWKWGYVLNTKFPNAFPQYSATTPLISLGYPRDVEAMSALSYSQIAGCVQWTHDAGASGSGYQIANAVFGGSYPDIANSQAAGASNPHATSGPFGGRRIGARAAVNTAAALGLVTSTVNKEPVISSVTRTTATTYNAACSTAGTCIDIGFTLTNGTALRTCGPSLDGGTTNNPPTGSCTATGIGAHVEGFRIGTASAMYFEDGLDPVGVTFAATKGFSCSIVAATTVECVATTSGAWSSTWTAGTMALSYGDPWSADRYGTLMGNGTAAAAGLSAFSITGGTGGTTGSYTNVTLTGGTCTTAPKVNVTISGGAVTAASVAKPGAGCTVAPTGITSASAGNVTGVTVSFPVGTFGTDMNLVGQLLYDNSAASGSLATIFGGNDPGLPVTPYNILGAAPAF
jgi:hypothetical protein